MFQYADFAHFRWCQVQQLGVLFRHKNQEMFCLSASRNQLQSCLFEGVRVAEHIFFLQVCLSRSLRLCDHKTSRVCSHRGQNELSPCKKGFCSITQLLSRPKVSKSHCLISQEPVLNSENPDICPESAKASLGTEMWFLGKCLMFMVHYVDYVTSKVPAADRQLSRTRKNKRTKHFFGDRRSQLYHDRNCLSFFKQLSLDFSQIPFQSNIVFRSRM